MTATKAADLPPGSIVASRNRCLMKEHQGWKYVGDTDLEPDIHAQIEINEGAVVLRHGYGNEGDI